MSTSRLYNSAYPYSVPVLRSVVPELTFGVPELRLLVPELTLSFQNSGAEKPYRRRFSDMFFTQLLPQMPNPKTEGGGGVSPPGVFDKNVLGKSELDDSITL